MTEKFDLKGLSLLCYQGRHTIEGDPQLDSQIGFGLSEYAVDIVMIELYASVEPSGLNRGSLSGVSALFVLPQ